MYKSVQRIRIPRSIAAELLAIDTTRGYSTLVQLTLVSTRRARMASNAEVTELHPASF